MHLLASQEHSITTENVDRELANYKNRALSHSTLDKSYPMLLPLKSVRVLHKSAVQVTPSH